MTGFRLSNNRAVGVEQEKVEDWLCVTGEHRSFVALPSCHHNALGLLGQVSTAASMVPRLEGVAWHRYLPGQVSTGERAALRAGQSVSIYGVTSNGRCHDPSFPVSRTPLVSASVFLSCSFSLCLFCPSGFGLFPKYTISPALPPAARQSIHATLNLAMTYRISYPSKQNIHSMVPGCNLSLFFADGAARRRLLLELRGLPGLVLIGCPRRPKRKAGMKRVTCLLGSATEVNQRDAQTYASLVLSPQSSPQQRAAVYNGPFKSSRLSRPGQSTGCTSPSPSQDRCANRERQTPWPQPLPHAPHWWAALLHTLQLSVIVAWHWLISFFEPSPSTPPLWKYPTSYICMYVHVPNPCLFPPLRTPSVVFNSHSLNPRAIFTRRCCSPSRRSFFLFALSLDRCRHTRLCYCLLSWRDL